MNSTNSVNSSLVLSYLGLRKAIGIIGIALPFVLVVGKVLLESPGINITLPENHLSAIDRYAQAHHLTRSGLLVQAAGKYINP